MAGGEGSRLRPLTYYLQKVMIPIGPSQRPLLEYVLRHIAFHGLREVIITVGYKAEQIINYFGDGSSLGLNIQYCSDAPDLKGSGHALHNAYRRGLVDEEDQLLLYYGDILSNIDLKAMLDQHSTTKAHATIATSARYQPPVGVVEVDGSGRVTAVREKPFIDLRVSIGIMSLTGTCLSTLSNMASGRPELDIMTHLMPRLVQMGYVVRVYETEAFWYDVGSTEKYEKLTAEMVRTHLNHLELRQSGGAT